MKNKISIKKIWLEAFSVMLKKPVIILPFVFIAFFESLALETIFFSTQKPLSFVFNPIVRKFFGEKFLHYPGNFFLLQKLFYFTQIVIYVFLGVFMMSMCVNAVKNAKSDLPLKMSAMAKNALKRYGALILFGIIVIILIVLSNKLVAFIFSKIMIRVVKFMPKMASSMYLVGISLFSFLANIVLQIFIVMTIPLMVIQKKALFKAFWKSICMGARNFFGIFMIILLPSLVYAPVTLSKSIIPILIDKTFPEISAIVTLIGIVVAVFVDSFILVCAALIVMNEEKSNV